MRLFSKLRLIEVTCDCTISSIRCTNLSSFKFADSKYLFNLMIGAIYAPIFSVFLLIKHEFL